MHFNLKCINAVFVREGGYGFTLKVMEKDQAGLVLTGYRFCQNDYPVLPLAVKCEPIELTTIEHVALYALHKRLMPFYCTNQNLLSTRTHHIKDFQWYIDYC